VVSTNPNNNAVDVKIDTTSEIVFNIPMNTKTVEAVLSIDPAVNHTLSWTGEDSILVIKFTEDLDYNTTYSITIGTDAEATTGGLLEEAPYVLNFTTEKELVIPPPEPKITITSPTAATEIKPGDTITVTGTSENMEEGTEIIITINGVNETAKIGADGTWSVSVKVPDEEGDYAITVSVGDTTTTETISVEKPKEQEKKEEDKSMFNTSIILIIIIILVALIVLFLMMRRKKPEPAEEELEEEE
jgi:hypothetical protein